MQSLAFSATNDQATFAELPASRGVFVLHASTPGAEPYISKAANLRRRITRLLAPPESQSKRLNLRERCGRIEFASTGSDFESVLLLYRLLRQYFPENYSKRLRLNLSQLIRIHWENAYPRAYVTRKLGALQKRSVYYGPFASRAAADKFLNDALDLFKSRRCTFELQPDPAFPGCVYSEMKMCLAPCFKGCTDAEYMAEMQRVQDFLDSRGVSLLHDLEGQRDQASAALDFETAASVHARVEKTNAVIRNLDEITQRLDRLDTIIVQPSAGPDEVALFRFHRGEIAGPVPFSMLGMLPAVANTTSGDSSLFGQPMLLQPVPEASPASAPAPPPQSEHLRERLEELHVTGNASMIFAEQLAVLKRWYFRSQRVGEIFFRNDKGEWPLRRILNGASRVFAAEMKSRQSAGG
jgi:excinuclease ABC subunit C